MAKFLSWLPTILSAITWLIGQIQAAQSQVTSLAGGFSSAEAASESISFWSNVETGGMVATGVSAAIAWVVNKFWGKLSTGKLQPHVQYQSAVGSKLILQKYVAGKPAALSLLESLDEPMAEVFREALKAPEKTAVVVGVK
jgi:hypothetical protein